MPNSEQIKNENILNQIKNNYQTGWNDFSDFVNTFLEFQHQNYLYSLKNFLKQVQNENLFFKDLFLYKNVEISNLELFNFSSYEFNMVLKFENRYLKNFNKKEITWINESWSKLDSGNLLLLSEDEYCNKISAWATSSFISYKNLNENDKKELTDLKNSKKIVPIMKLQGKISPFKKYFMFELPESFGFVLPFLEALSLMRRSTFPSILINPLIHHKFNENSNPINISLNLESLIKEDFIYDLPYNSLIKKSNETWIFEDDPSFFLENKLNVDFEQFKGLKHSLNYPLTLINGDPGTGKTHVACEIIKLLYKSDLKTPIIVVCYTNHSIDAVLEKIIKFVSPSDILRHGGVPRTENSIILDRNFNLNNFIRHHNKLKISKEEYEICLREEKSIYDLIGTGVETIEIIKSKKYLDDISLIKNKLILLFKNIRLFENYIESNYSYYNKKELEILKEQKFEFCPYKNWIQGDFYLFQCQDVLKVKNLGKPIMNKSSSLINIKLNSLKIIKKEDIKEIENVEEEEEEEIEEEEEKSIEFNDNDFFVDEMISNSKFEREKIEFSSDFFEPIEKKILELSKKRPAPLAEFIPLIEKIINYQYIKLDEIEKQRIVKENQYKNHISSTLSNHYSTHRIIALTATIAAKYKKSLENCGSEFVIIEEAGELTESSTLPFLPQTLQHLILIGDYNQLRPKVEYFLTKEPFRYDISTFERLVLSQYKSKDHFDLFKLNHQFRMHPNISKIIKNVYCPNLYDDESTKNIPLFSSIPFNIRFILHDKEEDKTLDSRSHQNEWEANYISRLIIFLLCREIKPEKITIISLYKGQQFLIKRKFEELWNKISQNEDIQCLSFLKDFSQKKINIQCLDNFQGEENDIIIVSISRSDKLGFVKNRNRSLVTLSRARSTLIVVGNRKLLTNKNISNEWAKVIEEAEKISQFSISSKNNFGLAIKKDLKNNDDVFICNNFEDLIKYKFSFNLKKCNELLDCNHHCPLTYHDFNHSLIDCQKRCNHFCRNKHQCIDICSNCSINNHHPDCLVPVRHKFVRCGHINDVPCHRLVNQTHICTTKCNKELPCGHQCFNSCGKPHHCSCTKKITKKCPKCLIETTYVCGNVFRCENCSPTELLLSRTRKKNYRYHKR